MEVRHDREQAAGVVGIAMKTRSSSHGDIILKSPARPNNNDQEGFSYILHSSVESDFFATCLRDTVIVQDFLGNSEGCHMFD